MMMHIFGLIVLAIVLLCLTACAILGCMLMLGAMKAQQVQDELNDYEQTGTLQVDDYSKEKGTPSDAI